MLSPLDASSKSAKYGGGHSPKRVNASPLRKTVKGPTINLDAVNKKKKKTDEKGENVQIELDSPTSVTL